jgi:hypothetical protein
VVAANEGIVIKSFSEGTVVTVGAENAFTGGLAGMNSGVIKNSYSVSKVVEDRTDSGSNFCGGLLGSNSGAVTSSYASGQIGNRRAGKATIGGVAGAQLNQRGYSNTYWDRDGGVRDPHQGVGNMADYPGVAGLTTAQLQVGLPAGFDPRVWQEAPAINGGLPYLRSNPPPQ